MPTCLIETHAHTNIVSPCGRLSPARLVRAYLRAGYDAIVTTDHLAATLPIFNGVDSWRERARRYFSGFRATAAAAVGTGLRVFAGFELTFADFPGNDFLVYGIDEQLLGEIPHPYRMHPAAFLDIATQLGAVVFQAHPFRGSGPLSTEYIDGIEVYNGNPRHDSRNAVARAFAERHNLLMIAGSDAHQAEDVGQAGVVLPESPTDTRELAAAFREHPNSVELWCATGCLAENSA